MTGKTGYNAARRKLCAIFAVAASYHLDYYQRLLAYTDNYYTQLSVYVNNSFLMKIKEELIFLPKRHEKALMY